MVQQGSYGRLSNYKTSIAEYSISVEVVPIFMCPCCETHEYRHNFRHVRPSPLQNNFSFTEENENGHSTQISLTGYFCGVLIFVIFMVSLQVTKISTHEFSTTHVIGASIHDQIATKFRTTRITSKRHHKLFTIICTPGNNPLYSMFSYQNVHMYVALLLLYVMM